MRDASLKQRIPSIIRISIFGAFSVGKECTLYTGKYGTWEIQCYQLGPRLAIGSNVSFVISYP